MVAAIPAALRPVILDSSDADDADARWLIAGWDPFETIGDSSTDPLAELDEALRKFESVPGVDGLLPGAAIGSLSYDLGRRYERLPSTALADAQCPDASIGLYDRLVLHDYRSSETWIVSTGLPAFAEAADARARERAREAVELLDLGPEIGRTSHCAGQVLSSHTSGTYAEAVRRVQEFIAAGDIYQANLTQRFSVSMGELAAAEVFLRLRERNPAAYGALIAEPGRTIVSASPERFLRVRGRDAEMWPIKGTRPRGETVEDDERLAAELVESVKDRAENLMIVDLVRNDLGRVAEFGSVVVDELFGHRRLPTVHHLVSRVSARLREDARGCDVLRAAFPCGSITGAPKIRAMEIIEEVEGVRRGVSMGAIGYCAFDGRMDWSVAIRTMEVVEGVARFNVGGGVVADSDPEQEYEESMWKARALLEALRG